MTKRDALSRLETELQHLIETLPEPKQPGTKQELDGFKRLFERYLRETGPSVDWDKIERLPEGSVSSKCTLSTKYL